jgi:hypothetical protein
MAWVDEPIEDPDEPEDRRHRSGCVTRDDGAVGDRDINSNVEGDMSQGRIERPAKDYRQNSG